MKILLIQTAFPGDVILATAFLADLAEAYPHAELHMLVRKGCEDLLADNPRLSCLWSWDKREGRYKQLLWLSGQLRRAKFDRVYNLQRYASSGFLTWRSGAPYRAGFRQNPWSWCFSHTVEHRIPQPCDQVLYLSNQEPHLCEGRFLHEVQRNALLLHPEVRPARRPELYLGEAEHSRAESFVAGRRAVVVAPASNWFTKQWHEPGWGALLALIPAAWTVFLVGGKEDAALCERIGLTRPGSVNLAGALRFRETAALMQRAEHVFTNDSAPLHLASAVNAPVTAVFCSTRPELGFSPLSDQRRVVHSEGPCCSKGIHGAKACPEGHFSCSRSITAEAVLGENFST